MMNFKDLIKTRDYDFLRDNPRPGDRIMLLGLDEDQYLIRSTGRSKGGVPWQE